ncbi:hypothetical protein [Streptosporangium sp. NPDC049644]|uniref:hypothetical protein n=1 Tax=Streptosporangium sp. NPDC049644 TaxID=3155507 RepID=UPI003416D4B4
MAEKLGMEPTKAKKEKRASAVDDARRRLITAGWLARGSHQGHRRVPHYAVGRPQETRAAHMEVPAWWGQRVQVAHSPGDKAPARPPSGCIRPDAWWLLVRMAEEMTSRTGLLDGGPKAKHRGVTTTYLAGLIGARSSDTGARRVAELEAAGLVEVTARRGGRLIVRPITDPAVAAAQAVRYARDGRRIEAPPPGRKTVTAGQNPAVDPPQNPAVHKESQLQGEPTSVEPGLPLAVGADLAVAGAGGAADAERPNQPPNEMPEAVDDVAAGEAGGAADAQECPAVTAEHAGIEESGAVDAPGEGIHRARPVGSVGVMALIPLEWQQRMSEAERERLLEAIEVEMLTGRSSAQMSARIHRLRAGARGDWRPPGGSALTCGASAR